MVSCPGGTGATNTKYCLWGGNASGAELNYQAQATEAVTFSDFGFRIISGGSGSNSLRMRQNGAFANIIASRTGTGTAFDNTNTDSMVSTDLFNLLSTVGGTSPNYGWIKSCVTFASGHGNFHGGSLSGGANYTANSTTTFQGYGGQLVAGGLASETTAGWEARGYDSQASLQVRVLTNARTTDTIVKNRIGGNDGTASITIGAGLTGIFTATGLTDAITEGQTVNASVTTGTGLGETLAITFVAATFKSTGLKSQTFLASSGSSRAASGTEDFLQIGGRLTFQSMTEAQARLAPGFAGIATNLSIFFLTNPYTGAATFTLYKNGVAAVQISIPAGQTGWARDLNTQVPFISTDEFSFGIVGGTANTATIPMMGMTFLPVASSYVSPSGSLPKEEEREHVRRVQAWWDQIDREQAETKAREQRLVKLERQQAVIAEQQAQRRKQVSAQSAIAKRKAKLAREIETLHAEQTKADERVAELQALIAQFDSDQAEAIATAAMADRKRRMLLALAALAA